jgi:hypothetical protein
MHVYQADDFIAGVIYLWYALKKKRDKITTPGNSQAFMIVFRKIHYTTLCKMRTFLLNLQFLPFAEMISPLVNVLMVEHPPMGHNIVDR